ncbi:MAPEG family protein [Legionella sp.]|uniref:MAPEG family protein n=1 Tax=Legionella sp. TaxID=459 RepID=UPI003CB77955
MNTLIVCLFIAILFPYLLKIVVGYFMKNEGVYDNHHPRIQQARLMGMGARAVAAHQNSFESLLVFTPAALTALVTNNVGITVQVLAIIYIISRLIYTIFYLKDYALLRSLTWFVGFICCLAILLACIR